MPAEAPADRVVYVPPCAPPTFSEFLSTQRFEPTPTGDLARDAAIDPYWPNGASERRAVKAYLADDRLVSDNVLNALNLAWKGYRRTLARLERGPRRRLPFVAPTPHTAHGLVEEPEDEPGERER